MRSPSEFFGILSRHFVTTFMHQLSRVATRVYAYLRTWCTSPAGQASDWRQLRVNKVAADLDWTPRYIRRGLAELCGAKLLERRATFAPVESDGRQEANEYRMLAEPGFPVSPEAPQAGGEGDDDRDDAPPPKEIPVEVADIILAETPAIVAILPSVAADEAVRLADDSAGFARMLNDLVAGDEVAIAHCKTPDQVATYAEDLRLWADDASRDAQSCQDDAGRPAVEVAAMPRWFPVVVKRVQSRARVVLLEKGWRPRRVDRVLAPEVVRRLVANYLVSQGAPAASWSTAA